MTQHDDAAATGDQQDGRQRSAVEQLATDLALLAERHQVPGAQVAVLQNGCATKVFHGFSSVGGPAVDDSTKFPIGSLTKPLTAMVALLAAADEGLDPDGSLPLVTEVPISLRQLLSHTAGLPSAEDVDPGLDLAGWVRRSRGRRVVREPGTAFSYSNLGYMLAGRFIEVSTGESWADAVRTTLATNTDLDVDLDLDENDVWARGHHVFEGPTLLQPEVMAPAEHPAGAAGASAHALAGLAELFCRVSAHSLGADAIGPMLDESVAARGHSPAGLADGWTAGWAVYDDHRGRSYGHDGTSDGVSCHLRFDPSRSCALAFTGNSSTAEQLWWDLQELPMIRDLGLADLRSCAVRSPDGPAAHTQALPGVYRNGPTELVLEHAPGGLVLRIDGAVFADVTHFPSGELQFHKRAGRGALAGRWYPAARGLPPALQVSGRRADRVE